MKKQSKPTYRIYFQNDGIYFMRITNQSPTWLSQIIDHDYFVPYSYN